VEEPDLGEHQDDRHQCDRDRTAAGDHERQEPDEVLRREDLGEGEEAGDRRGEGERQARAQVAEPRIEDPHGRDREPLEHEQDGGNRVGGAAGQVAPGDARRLDDVRVVEPEPVECEQQRGAEALDLQAACGLGVEALVDAMRRVGRERRHYSCRDDHQHAERERRPPRAGPAPDEPGREWYEHQRIDLRADRKPEHGEGRQLPAAQQ